MPPPPPPGPASAPIAGGNSITGQNCTTNPDFCNANQASISTCDMSFGMGDAMVTGASLGLAAPDDKTVMYFRGPQIMAASIKKLASLGLSKATKVLLTGTAGAGQQVFLQADLFHAAVKAVAPGLTVFKALPVDGLRPNLHQTLFCTAGIMGTNCCPKNAFGTPACWSGPGTKAVPSWYVQSLAEIKNVSQIKGPVSSLEALPSIKTPLFAVNQMVATWDAQCQYEGQPSGNILQVACSQRGNYL